MDLLFQIALKVLGLCAVAFVIGLIQLIANKGKSKIALRVVLISAITACIIVVVGFSACVFTVTR
jgi:hypothetical protein